MAPSSPESFKAAMCWSSRSMRACMDAEQYCGPTRTHLELRGSSVRPARRSSAAAFAALGPWTSFGAAHLEPSALGNDPAGADLRRGPGPRPDSSQRARGQPAVLTWRIQRLDSRRRRGCSQRSALWFNEMWRSGTPRCGAPVQRDLFSCGSVGSRCTPRYSYARRARS